MDENWAGKMIRLFSSPEKETNILFARLETASPPTILINNQIIEKYVYKIESVKGLLPGDLLVVVRNCDEFYIIGKVEK